MTSLKLLYLLLVILTARSVKTYEYNMFRDFMETKAEYLASASNPKIPVPCTTRYSCVNCTAARVCAPLPDKKEFKEVRHVKCTGNTPFCDNRSGTCTSTQSQKCAYEGNFVCLSDGYFPDQTSCQTYHFCQNSESYTFICPINNHNYDLKSQSCVYEIECYPFNCDNKNGYKVKHPMNPTFYAYCVGNKALFVDRCPGENQLNETSQVCEPICTREGLMEDTLDCRSYYKCKFATEDSVMVTYSMTHHTCPEGQAYSPTGYQCVSTEQVHGCYVEPANLWMLSGTLEPSITAITLE